MQFEFATAARVLFGWGALEQVGPLARLMGEKALVITGSNTTRARRLLELLAASDVNTTLYSVTGEPTISIVSEGVALGRDAGSEMVIAFGGGSVIDAAKAIAAMLTNEGELLDYLEVIGNGRSLRLPSAPLVAIPTTAGTGSEVTRNAVITSPSHRVKVSLRSHFLLPRLALIDPSLTITLPPEVTARSGLDALTQLIEPFVSRRANPLVDSLCREGMKRAARSLRQAFYHGEDRSAREEMSLASLFGGLALANAGLGAVHGLASPLGGMINAPHGTICGRLLPLVMETNIHALREREPTHPSLSRYEEIARLLSGNPLATAEEGIDWVRQLVDELGLPSLRQWGLTEEQIPSLVEAAMRSSSIKSNPILLTAEELTRVLQQELAAG